MKGIISMSDKEVDRVGVMQRLAAREIRNSTEVASSS